MPMIPLAKILKGRPLKIAEFQDLLLVELSKRFDYIVHGGTAVWRVYGGKRFSYDIDIYYDNPGEVIDYLSGIEYIRLSKSKITSSKVAYLRVSNEVSIELDISPIRRRLNTMDVDLWLTDGSTIVVKSLTPEDLIMEKIEAFIDRRKSRDLYDIYYLIDFCSTNLIKNALSKLIIYLDKEPEDFKGLKELILIGKIPTFKSIKRKVMRYAEDKI